jgi:ATP-dependent Clp endopeptidase proteolytic subunit ClpP
MRKWFTIQNRAGTDPAEILIYEQIGKDWFTNDGIGAKEFAEALAEIPKSKEIVVGINSPGGNVWDGLAIYHQLKSRGDKVSTRIDGVAASIASVIALAGSKLSMPENALMMIHRAWGVMVGNESDMKKMADDLAKHDGVIAGIYSEKNKKSREENLKAMEAETWFNGLEAKTFGFVDDVTSVVSMSNAIPADALARFKNPPAALITPPTISAPIVGADGNQKGSAQKTNHMNPTPVTPAEPTPATPATDFAPVIAAINALGDTIKAGQTPPPGAPPRAPAALVKRGNPAVEKFLNMEHGHSRREFIENNYGTLHRELQLAGIFKAQTTDAGLANSLLASTAVDTMRTLIAPLNAFTRSVELSPVSARQTINVPLTSSAGSIQTNPSNFETGDTTQALIAVVVNQYSKSFFCAHADANSGLRLAQYAPTNAMVMAEGIVALVTALMTNANYGADVVIGAAASFDSADLPAVLALAKNYKRAILLLDGGHLAYLLPTTREHFAFGEPGAYGFDGGIYKNNLWTGGATDICGLITGPDAICIASGLPANLPSGEMLTQENVAIGAGLSVTASTWFSRSSRAMWGSFDIMFGCKVGDATQAEVLTTQ